MSTIPTLTPNEEFRMSQPAATAGRGRILAVLAIATLAVTSIVSLGACGNGGKGTRVLGNEPTGQPGIGAVSTGPSSSPTDGGTPASAPPTHPYPSDYARTVVTAWVNRDASFLTLLTNASSKNRLFSIGSVDQHWTLAASEGAAGSSYASFFNDDGDWIVIRMINAQIAARQWHAGSIQAWDKIAYPADAVAYVNYYMNAYLDGNTARMTELGNQAMTTHFMGLTTKPNSEFTVGTPDGTAGHTHIEVTEPTASFDVTFRLVNQNLGVAHAMEGCDSGC